MGTIKEFILKDVIHNIDPHKEKSKRFDDLESRKDIFAVGTTKILKSNRCKEYVPFNFVANMNSLSRIKTDKISFNPPANEIPLQKIRDFILTKPNYCQNNETREGWKEKGLAKTLRNKSSVGYDIISFNINNYSGGQIVRTLEKKLFNHKKGISEFADLTRVASKRENPDHIMALKENPNGFFRKTGLFTHIQDMNSRFGKNFTKPI